MDLNQYTLGTPHHLAARGVQAEKLEAVQKIKQKRMEMNAGVGGGERKRERHTKTERAWCGMGEISEYREGTTLIRRKRL